MTNSTEKASHLEMRWVEVADISGRTQLEARWVLLDHAPTAAHAA